MTGVRIKLHCNCGRYSSDFIFGQETQVCKQHASKKNELSEEKHVEQVKSHEPKDCQAQATSPVADAIAEHFLFPGLTTRFPQQDLHLRAILPEVDTSFGVRATTRCRLAVCLDNRNHDWQ